MPTPALDRIAAAGRALQRSSTRPPCARRRALRCSPGATTTAPTSAAISEIAYGFPGYDGIIPRSTATVAEILRQNGYSTAMFGKAHVTPMWETSPAGPFDRWPTGLGFERFYGFLGGETSQWEPALYDQTDADRAVRRARRLPPDRGSRRQGDRVDAARRSCRRRASRSSCTSPRAARTAPHHVWPGVERPLPGQFDDGWDSLRERTLAAPARARASIPPRRR